MRRSRSKGYTLIELLIVVVIIGILATIAVGRFMSIREKAYDGAAKSDLRNAITAQERYYSDNQTYATDVADLDFNSSANVTVTVESGDGSGYTMTAKHVQGQCWEVDSAVGGILLRGASC